MTRRIIQIYRGTTAQNDAFTGSAGELTMDTTRKELRVHDGSTVGGKVVGLTPGFITPFAGSTAPDGWLICDGSAVSRTTYAALFAVIGTTYGEGDGNSTFNLPNKSPTRQVIEFQEPTAQNNYMWYRLYDDGWVEQGGFQYNPGGATGLTKTLPITMADTNFVMLVTNDNSTAPSGWYPYGVSVKDSSSIVRAVGSVAGVWYGTNSNWYVCGMSARGATQQNIMCIKY